MLQAMMVSLSLMSAELSLATFKEGAASAKGLDAQLRKWVYTNAERIHQQLKSEEDEASRR